MSGHAVVGQEEWLKARLAHLAKEKALTRERDALLEERRELPWTLVQKKYVFDSASGKKTLAELFGDKSQLVIYHFMLAPEWEQGCQSCSMASDTMDANYVHLTQRDVAFAAVSRASMEQITAFKKRMGWRFPWVSSFGGDFNWDFHVSFPAEEQTKDGVYNFGTAITHGEEMPGVSVFKKGEDGEVFYTYSTYGRGLEGLLAVYDLMDMTPKGRDEAELEWPMAWVRHHDRYETQPSAQMKASCCGAHGE
jgi:predicted dithiol-disulfide oxidoreductase (DUF899 family)